MALRTPTAAASMPLIPLLSPASACTASPAASLIDAAAFIPQSINQILPSNITAVVHPKKAAHPKPARLFVAAPAVAAPMPSAVPKAALSTPVGVVVTGVVATGVVTIVGVAVTGVSVESDTAGSAGCGSAARVDAPIVAAPENNIA